MTPQEERLVLELHARWGNRFEIGSEVSLLFFFFSQSILLFTVYCLCLHDDHQIYITENFSDSNLHSDSDPRLVTSLLCYVQF
jgi:hypothetical protein